MELEVVGPRVAVDRNGTGDRGGGQLVLKQGTLLVRTRSMERPLSATAAIDRVELLDLARLQAKVCLSDGQVWNVHSERGEDLTAFFREVATAAGRQELLRDPPRVSDFVRQAATPARKRLAWQIALALLAYAPLRWLAGLAPGVGLALAILGLLALLAGAAATLIRHAAVARALAPLRPRVSWPSLVAATALSLAGVNGHAAASADAARDAERARAQAEAAAREQAEAARRAEEARERRAQADALAVEMKSALQAERVRDAQALRERIDTLVPGHPAVAQAAPELDRALAELDERERVRGLARGIAAARVLARDRVACETGKRVADAYAQLRLARPSDADYAAAQRAVETLEQCRVRVAQRYAQAAEESRRRTRQMAAPQVETAVRQLGYPVTVSLQGANEDVMRLEAPELDARAVERIFALGDRKRTTFEAARTEEGWKRIELRGRSGFSRALRLEPVPAKVLVLPVLEELGLAKPLELAAAGQ